jgi:hypothetical protein
LDVKVIELEVTETLGVELALQDAAGLVEHALQDGERNFVVNPAKSFLRQ